MNNELINSWILVCNSRYFDIKRAFEMTNTITWPVKDGIDKGATVYLYVTNPYRAIMYKCEVIDVNIHHMDETSKNCVSHALFYEGCQTYIQLRKVTEYPVDLIKDIELQKCGIQNLQMALRVSEHLESMIRQKEQELRNSLIKKKLLKFIPMITILIIIMVIVFVVVNNKKLLLTKESVAVESNNNEVDEDKYNVDLKQEMENTPEKEESDDSNYSDISKDSDVGQENNTFIYTASDIVLVNHKIDLKYVEDTLYRTGMDWKSSNENVAVVSKDGVLSALSPGETEISANGIDSKQTIIVVNRNENPKVEVRFDYDSISLHYGEEDTIHITFAGELPEKYGAVIYPSSGMDLSLNFEGQVIDNQVDVSVTQGFNTSVDSGNVYILVYEEGYENEILGVGTLRVKNSK